MTSLPAQREGLQDRGLLKEGYFADISVFDPRTILDKATYMEPAQLSTGVKYVFVNGQLEFEDGKLTGSQGDESCEGRAGILRPAAHDKILPGLAATAVTISFSGWMERDESNRNTARPAFGPPILRYNSGHLGSGNFVAFPRKRHQRSCLVFSPTCFASRGSPVRSRPRPPSFPFGFIELTAVASLAIPNRAPSSRRSTMWANLPISIRIHGSVKLYNKFPFSTDDRKLVF
jgi:hypothetical protein